MSCPLSFPTSSLLCWIRTLPPSSSVTEEERKWQGQVRRPSRKQDHGKVLESWPSHLRPHCREAATSLVSSPPGGTHQDGKTTPYFHHSWFQAPQSSRQTRHDFSSIQQQTLVTICCVPGIVLDAWDKMVNKTKTLVIAAYTFQQREEANNKRVRENIYCV